MKRILLGTVLIAVLHDATAGADELTLFDAATTPRESIAAQDGATLDWKPDMLTVRTKTAGGYPGFTVEGPWDLSAYGEIAVEFVGGGRENRCTVRLLNAGGRPDGKGCFITKFRVDPWRTQVRSQPIPPDLPGWRGILSELKGIRTWALPYLLWNTNTAGVALWNHEDVPVSTLNRKWVAQAAVYVNAPGAATAWSVRRIVARGKPIAAESLPAFARMSAAEFFPFIDEYGQFKHRDWPDKIHSDADLAAQREKEAKDLAAHPGPNGWDKWGGWADGPKFPATGGFSTVKWRGKWWIVDPDGNLWWSHGAVRVTPSSAITPLDGRTKWFARLPEPGSSEALFYTTKDELLYPYYGRNGFTRTYDFSAQNIRRKYGENWFEAWADLAHRRLRSWGCNTIANSSDRRICLMDRTPYTERFEVHSKPLAGHKGGWWDFADPFDPSFRAEARRQASEVFHREFADPWCIGFFVDNEQNWGEPHTLGVSTLKSPADQTAKRVLVERLKAKYGTIAALNAAWRTAYADWEGFLSTTTPPADLTGAKADLAAFTTEMTETYYRVIKEEIKRANPGKLYLGCRYAGVPKDFVVRAAAKHCDILSYNIYTPNPSWFKLPEGVDKPVLIGEFHFGALDRGPFCPGLILLKDQKERAKVYGEYVRGALAHPNLVGVHWHQFSDQATSGRFDGENMQVGWTDVCDTPYRETVEAVREVGSNLYRIRAGEAK